MKLHIFIFSLLLISIHSFCQVGVGTGTPNPSAVLDLVSPDKGLLLPRISLVKTSDFQPLKSHIAGMVIYNKALVNDVKPGYYFNDGTKWINISETVEKVNEQQARIADLENSIPIKRAIFIAGQSNTTNGMGFANIPDFSGKNLSQLGRFGVNLEVVPLTFYGTYQNIQNVNGGSFGSVFLYHHYNKLRQEYPNRAIQLLLIPCGATTSGWAASQYPGNSWRTDAAYFADIVSRIKWAKNNGYQVDAFLWHQGETDALAQTVNYKDIIKNFIQSIRDYAANQKLPFILGEMAHGWVAATPSAIPYQAVINDIPNEVPYTGTSSSAGLSMSDGIHFDAQGHVDLGLRYYNKYLTAINNSSPSNYTVPANGEHLVFNYNSSTGLVFPDIFSSLRFDTNPSDLRYSVLGDIWKYKNSDEFFHFKLEVVNGTGISGGVFEWKQKINPFGLSDKNIEDRSGFVILANTIGLNTSAGQRFTSLAYDTPANSTSFATLFHADVRSNQSYFSIGQTVLSGNNIPIIETNNTVNHVRLYCIKE